MANSETNESFSDNSSDETLFNSSSDLGHRDFSLSENDLTLTRSFNMAELLKGEKSSFEMSVPTTSTQSDGEEQWSFFKSTPILSYYSAEHLPLSKKKNKSSKKESYDSCSSNGKSNSFHKTLRQTSSLQRCLSLTKEEDDKKCSNLQTIMNAYKGNSGPGLLSLPLAFRYAGLWVGLSGFFVIAVVAVHSMHILSKCAAYLDERFGRRVKSYPDVVGALFEECAPPKLKKYSNFMRIFVDILIQVMQCGFCCVYIVFVSTNVKEIVDQLWEGSPPIWAYELVTFCCVVPYLMIRSLKTLAFFSSIANFLFITGLIIVFQFLLQDLRPTSRLPAFSSFQSLPLFLGNAVFAFEGISLVVPLRAKMKEPESFGGSFGVLNLVMTFHSALCAAVGFFGYLRFGDDTASTITLNLPTEQTLYRSVDAMFALVVFLSTAVQFYVPINSTWSSVERRLKNRKVFTTSDHSDRLLSLAQCLVRFLLILLILLVALFVPHIDLLISLLGALMGSLLTMIIPGVIDMMILHFQGKLNVAYVLKDVVIMAFGVLTLVMGSYVSLVAIIDSF